MVSDRAKYENIGFVIDKTNLEEIILFKVSTYIFYCIWNFLEKWNFCWNYDNFNVKHASYNYNVI